MWEYDLMFMFRELFFVNVEDVIVCVIILSEYIDEEVFFRV